MIDLNSYIKVDFLRSEIQKSSIVVTNIDEADLFALNISQGIIQNVIFEKSSLKSYCFDRIKTLCDVNIINCNSCIDRFCEDYAQSSKVTIFDNINQCKNPDILDIIFNSKGILVC